jgi:hypothetical protein
MVKARKTDKAAVADDKGKDKAAPAKGVTKKSELLVMGLAFSSVVTGACRPRQRA